MAIGGVTPSQRDEAFPADGGRGHGLFKPAGAHVLPEPWLPISSAAEGFSDERQNFLCS